MSRGPQNFFIFCLALRSEEVLVVDRKRWWFSDRKRLLLLLVVRSEEISVVLRSEVDSKASQSGPSEREAEDAPGTPLPGAAPRHTALAGSHHSPWWGSETSRRRGEKVGRSAGVRDQYWTSLWADRPGRPGRNRGRSHAVGRQELLRRVHKLSMVSCGLIRASLYLLVVLCDFSACHLCF